MNLEDKQVNTLIQWVNVRLAPSPIHGIGVFALKDIPEGTKLYMDIMPMLFTLPYRKIHNNLPEYISSILLERWPLIKQGSPFVYPDARYVAYCNHAEDANYSANNDMTLRDIKAGEEVTEDYRLIPNAADLFDFIK
jgi:hypothetical protein